MAVNQEPAALEKKPSVSDQRLSVVMTATFLLCFFFSAVKAAAGLPLWMDEILAVWVIRMPDLTHIYQAIRKGSEFSPPTFHILLHYWATLFGSSDLTLRMPSILATMVTGLCVFLYTRRHLGPFPAVFAVCVVLMGMAANYALQVRQYAFIVALFSIVLILWSDLIRTRWYGLRVFSIFALLSLTISLHFYSVLLVVALGCMELLWEVYYRRFRALVWLGLFLAGCSILLWLPLIHQFTSFNAGDIHSPSYYGRPTIGFLTHSYTLLFVFEKKHSLLLLSAVIIVLLASALTKLARQRQHEERSLSSETSAEFFIVTMVTTFYPLLVFLFARLITGTFNIRYFLIANIGVALATTYVFSRWLNARRVMLPVFIAACAVVFIANPQLSDIEPALLSLAAAAPKDLPIVVGEGRIYFELMEFAPDSIKARLHYLTDPPNTKLADPTNENQIKRWYAINPQLQVSTTSEFFQHTKRFLVLHSENSSDALTPWLVKNSLIRRPLVHVGDAWLFEAVSSAEPAPAL